MTRCLSRFGQERAGSPPSSTAIAGHLFSNWPDNFYVQLKELVFSDTKKDTPVLRRDLNRIYKTICKYLSTAEDISFLRIAISNFSETLQVYKPGRARAATCTLLPAIKRAGCIPSKRPNQETSVSSDDILKTGIRSFGERDAARLVDLPVSVLHFLRQTGHFAAVHRASRIMAYHEADIAAFNEKIRKLPIAIQQPNADTISMREALQKKIGFSYGKGELVAAVLSGKLTAFHTSAPGIQCLLLLKKEVQLFIETLRAGAFGETLTPTEVHQILHCGPQLVPTLLEQGLLMGNYYPAGLRISRQSVDAFDAKYCSFAAVAKASKTTTKALLSNLSKYGVLPPVNIVRSHDGGSWSFIRRDQLHLLPIHETSPIHE